MIISDVNPGEVWRHGAKDYSIVGTAITRGDPKWDRVGVVMIVYKSSEHPLLLVRDRMDFLRKFRRIKKK